MNNKISLIIGILLVILGIVFIANTLHIWSLESSWPMILLIIGSAFFVAFFSSKTNPGVLLPGAILIITSIPFFICSTSDQWHLMASLWPMFLLGPAIGFFLMYFGGIRDKGLLVPAFILTGLTAIFFLAFSYFSYLWPIVFILAGGIFIFLGIKDKKKEIKTVETTNKPAATENPK
jgi:hypothetical protein